jgi:hypothetical protein
MIWASTSPPVCPFVTAYQQWTFNGTKFFLTSTAGSKPPKCMDIADFNTAPGAEVYTWPCGDGSGANEVWVVAGSQIKSGQTPATCLAVAAAAPTVGTQVTTDVCNPADPLQALLFDAATGLITHTPSNLCVDGGSPVPPTPWCAVPPRSAWTFCDPSAPLDDRAADIVARLSVADKVKSLVTGTAPLSSVGLPAYQWWSEATHGISGPGVHYDAAHPGASNTALPITTSCSFNRSLWRATGNQIAREGRAFRNLGLAASTFW